MTARILDALGHLYDDQRRSWQATADYRSEHGINISQVAGHCGCPTVTPITLLPNRRFDLPNPNDEIVEGCVIEARGEDGESVIDLVAWPVADPADVRTLLGRVPILGLSQAFNASTYVFGYPLVVHRTGLDWLRAGCQGAAVVIPKFAAKSFLKIADMGGRIGASDPAHARELKAHLAAMISTVKIVSPQSVRRAA